MIYYGKQILFGVGRMIVLFSKSARFFTFFARQRAFWAVVLLLLAAAPLVAGGRSATTAQPVYIQDNLPPDNPAVAGGVLSSAVQTEAAGGSARQLAGRTDGQLPPPAPNCPPACPSPAAAAGRHWPDGQPLPESALPAPFPPPAPLPEIPPPPSLPVEPPACYCGQAGGCVYPLLSDPCDRPPIGPQPPIPCGCPPGMKCIDNVPKRVCPLIDN